MRDFKIGDTVFDIRPGHNLRGTVIGVNQKDETVTVETDKGNYAVSMHVIENCNPLHSKQRKRLYTAYANELNALLKEPISTAKAEDSCNKQMSSPNTTWIDICSDNKIIGFLIISHGTACHPDADRYIVNTYIAPEYRRKHYASVAMRAYLDKHPGTYVLDIINNNTPALTFWNNIFTRNGYEPIKLRDIPHGMPEDTTFYAWQPKKG